MIPVNKNPAILIAALFLVLGMLSWWFWSVNRAAEKTPHVAKSAETALTTQRKVSPAYPPATTGYPTPTDEIALQDRLGLSVAQKTILRENPSAAARFATFTQILTETNSKRIDFYGKVVDQHGHPIAGVQVNGSILLAVSPISSANKEVITETDSAGKFQFVGLHGAGFGLLLKKTGYEYNGKANWSAVSNPDPNNPVVFILWKLQGAEPMVHTKLNGRLPFNAQSGVFGASFDMSIGMKSDSGDLHISLTQKPLSVTRGTDHFEWEATIGIQGGGLIEATDPYMNLAPESSYKNVFSFAQGKDDPSWVDRLVKTFYVHTANGQYGKVSIALTPGSNRPEIGLGIGLSIETWMNPSGSRNLEFDPSKEIKTTSIKSSRL
jgi:hypothetical protein